MILIVMGVSGSGKTTIGSTLAQSLGWEFLDGDDFHPMENLDKMSRGIPLTDADRTGWLSTLASLVSIRLARGGNAILACSALKQSYRDILSAKDARVRFVYLRGSRDLIASRMHKRSGHFMLPEMLNSQFDALEEPSSDLTVDIKNSPDEIVRQVIEYFDIKSRIN